MKKKNEENNSWIFLLILLVCMSGRFDTSNIEKKLDEINAKLDK